MKKTIISYLIGVFSGIVISVIYIIVSSSGNTYIQLQADYQIDNGGKLKNGTILKTDKVFSEGFTRYILFINLRDSEKVKPYNAIRSDVTIPYWLELMENSKDTSIQNNMLR